ncbi:MAG: PTS fructose transporter subunit IIA [gamma proteobacterium symbiont of Bathyaustriella thionipta]|nr:PTS fructose transporter subunit IIA [gamma proteobacterium symbiont of Bathyaustriella thionipta]
MSVGILLITHEGLGEALLSTLGDILGQTPQQIATYSVINDADHPHSLQNIQTLAASLEYGEGLLILTDLCGATPHNRVMEAKLPEKSRLVSGVNLPMLIKAITYRHLELDALTQKVVAGGKDCITIGACRKDTATT